MRHTLSYHFSYCIRGLWKYEIEPEDVTINYISKDMSNAPQPPAGHKWKAVVSNKNAFVATYYDIRLGENVVTLHKKFGFGALSTVKQDADIHKYEKAHSHSSDTPKKLVKKIRFSIEGKLLLFSQSYNDPLVFIFNILASSANDKP